MQVFYSLVPTEIGEAGFPGLMNLGRRIGVEFETRAIGEIDGLALPNRGLIDLVVEITEPVGLPDSVGGDQGKRSYCVATTRWLPVMAGKEGARFGEFLIGDVIESAHLFPQGFGFGEGIAIGLAGIQPDEKCPLTLGTVLAIAPPGQPCGGCRLDFFRGGSVGWGQGCARSK
jgi:hypothetical protein